MSGEVFLSLYDTILILHCTIEQDLSSLFQTERAAPA
jgi:hypothetical protein